MKTIKTFRELTPAFNLMISFLLIFGFFGCSKDDAPPPVVKATPKEEVKLSDAKAITSFVFLLTNNPIEVNVVATIDEENKTIIAALPPGTDIKGLLPEVKTSELATVNLTTAQDFTEPLEYEVTAEDGSTAVYTVIITALLTQRQILQAILDANPLLDWDLQNTIDFGDLSGVITNALGEIVTIAFTFDVFSVIPPEIGQLKKMKKLSLIACNIKSIPSEIGQLKELEYLDLGINGISELPVELFSLTGLTKLTLISNAFSSMPIEIGQLTNLKELHLGNGQLTSLPPGFEQLTNLTSFSIGGPNFTSLTSEIGQLTNLKSLSLERGKLTELPPELGQLTNLTELFLGSNELSELPPEIGELTNLKYLNLNTNQITQLPTEIGQLKNLEELYLAENQLISIPPEIGFLSNLKSLAIYDNNLTTIPQAICNWEEFSPFQVLLNKDTNVTCSTTSQKDALISIYSANPGNTLGWGVDNYPKVTFDNSSNPIILNMNNTNLTRIPDSISELKQLEELSVNDNQLNSLPVSLSTIQPLKIIAAASNNITTVPSEFELLSGLGLLLLTQNPISSIPQAVCDQQISNGGILTILADPGEGCD